MNPKQYNEYLAEALAQGDPRYVYCFFIPVNADIGTEIEVAGDTKKQAHIDLKAFIAGRKPKTICRCRWRQPKGDTSFIDIFDGITPNPDDLKNRPNYYQYREDF